MAPIDNVKASCLCGSVVIQTMVRRCLNMHHKDIRIGRPFKSFLCHCSICQQFTGADFEHALAWGWDKVELVKGQDVVETYQSSGHVQRKFCSRCSSGVYAEEKLAGEIPCKVVLAGCLEHGPDGRIICWDDPALKPKHHIFYDTHILDFRGDGIPKWEGFPHKSKQIDDVSRKGWYSRM